MAKKKFKNTKLKWILLSLVLIFAIGIIGYFNKTSLKPLSKISKPNNCSDIATIVDIVKDSIKSQGKIEVTQPDESVPNKQYTWRLNQNEPYRTYPSNLVFNIFFYGQKLEDTDTEFKVKTYPKIISLGFTKNELNSHPLLSSDEIDFSLSRYGITKGDDRVVISISGALYEVKDHKSIKLPDKSSVISIKCGLANQQSDDIYNEVIRKSPNLKDSEVLNILEIKDHVVTIDLSNYLSGLGVGQYWIDRGKGWEKIFEGQYKPSCSLFNIYGVGKEMGCQKTN